MGNLQSGLITTFENAVSSVEADIVTLAADYATAETARQNLRITADGTVWLGSSGTVGPGGYGPMLRLDDILSAGIFGRLIADRMNGAGMRAVLEAWAKAYPSGAGNTALLTAVENVLSGH